MGELAKIFSVSTETIRKDLLELESKRLIKKNNGSAEILRESSASAYARKSSGFLGTDGPCVENFPEAEVKQEMIKNAQRTYVLADHSKLHIRAIAKFADWSEITGVIMDEHAAPEDIKELQKKVDVLLAKKEG